MGQGRSGIRCRQREMVTVSSTTGPTDGPLPLLADTGHRSQRGPVRRRVLTGVGLVAALGIGIAIGAAAGNNSGALATANNRVSALQGQVTSLKG